MYTGGLSASDVNRQLGMLLSGLPLSDQNVSSGESSRSQQGGYFDFSSVNPTDFTTGAPPGPSMFGTPGWSPDTTSSPNSPGRNSPSNTPSDTPSPTTAPSMTPFSTPSAPDTFSDRFGVWDAPGIPDTDRSASTSVATFGRDFATGEFGSYSNPTPDGFTQSTSDFGPSTGGFTSGGSFTAGQSLADQAGLSDIGSFGSSSSPAVGFSVGGSAMGSGFGNAASSASAMGFGSQFGGGDYSGYGAVPGGFTADFGHQGFTGSTPSMGGWGPSGDFDASPGAVSSGPGGFSAGFDPGAQASGFNSGDFSAGFEAGAAAAAGLGEVGGFGGFGNEGVGGFGEGGSDPGGGGFGGW